GTPNSEVERARQMGKSLLFDIDVKGGLSIRRQFPRESLLIFIAPPDLKTLEARLRARKTESESTVQRRLERAQMEMSMAGEYGHVVVNDDLERAIQEIEGIMCGHDPASTEQGNRGVHAIREQTRPTVPATGQNAAPSQL